MGLGCINVSEKGETKKNMNQIVYIWQCRKRIEVKERIMFIGGCGFRVQKIKAKGNKCLQNWERLKMNEVKLSGNGNLRWQIFFKRHIQEDFDKVGLG